MFIQEADQKVVRDFFEQKLANPVKLVVFSQEKSSLVLPNSANTCQYCSETEQLVKEVAELSDKITVEVVNFEKEPERAKEYNVDKIPAIAVVGEKDYGIRFFGIPSGYEFTSLMESIANVSQTATELSETTREKLKNLDTDVHIQVFVTPTCPHCPGAVRMGHMMALENEHIKADMVEAQEFMELSRKYGVMGVPRVVINEDTVFEGSLPEENYLDYVLQAVGKVEEKTDIS